MRERQSATLWSRLTPKRRQGLYEQWVGSFGADLYRMAYRLCGQRDTAEDLVQETFYHAWKDMNHLRHHDKARAWLYQILRHRYAHWVRDGTRRIEVASIDNQMHQVVDPDPSALARLADQDELQAALNELDEPVKTPLLMVFLEGLTCREVAKAMDIPLGTVLSRIYRARQKMQSFFEAQADVGTSPSAGRVNADQSRQLRLGGGA